jgi:integrase
VHLPHGSAFRFGCVADLDELPHLIDCHYFAACPQNEIVPISTKTAVHLAQYISVYHTKERPGTDLLFFTVIKNVAGMMSEGNVERFVKEYARKVQCSCPSVPDHVHPHMFRRKRKGQSGKKTKQ